MVKKAEEFMQVYGSAIILLSLSKIIKPKFFNKLDLDILLAEILSKKNINENKAKEILSLCKNLMLIGISPEDNINSIPIKLLASGEIKKYLLINEWDGVEWFNKEQAEKIALQTILFMAMNAKLNKTTSSTNKKPEELNGIYKGLIEKIENSEYKVENLA